MKIRNKVFYRDCSSMQSMAMVKHKVGEIPNLGTLLSDLFQIWTL